MGFKRRRRGIEGKDVRKDWTRIVQTGCTEGLYHEMMGHSIHRRWVERAARHLLRRYPRSRPLYDAEDVEQLVRYWMWHALRNYRWICSSHRDWYTRSFEDWKVHAATHRKAVPLKSVGDYVSFNISARVKSQLLYAYRAKRLGTRAQISNRVDSAETDVEWHTDEKVVWWQSEAELEVLMSGLTQRANSILSPMSQRMLVRLTEGYSSRQIIEMEADKEYSTEKDRRQHRRVLNRNVTKAKNFLGDARELIIYA